MTPDGDRDLESLPSLESMPLTNPRRAIVRATGRAGSTTRTRPVGF